MKTTRKAILWGQNDLLTSAMEQFLTAGETWQVIKVPREAGQSCLLAQAKQIQPDVIILCTGNRVQDPALPMELTRDQPDLRVITVNLEGNQLQVYSKQSIMVRKGTDLLSILEDRYFLDHPIAKEVEQARIESLPDKKPERNEKHNQHRRKQ